MDGIEIRVTGATPLEALARIGAFGMHCLANTDVCAAAKRICEAEAAKEKAAQLDVAKAPEGAPPPIPGADGATPTARPATPVSATVPVASATPAMQASVTAPTHSPSVLPGQMAIASPAEAPAAPTVPLAPTAVPHYSLDDITRAGADFIVRHPDKQEALNGLFPQFGITTLAELRPEQMGLFATAMRALGVSI